MSLVSWLCDCVQWLFLAWRGPLGVLAGALEPAVDAQGVSMAFLAALRKEVKRLAEIYSIPEHRAFAVWFGTTVLDLDEDDAFDALSVEGPNEKGMDLFWVDNPNQRVLIGQCKYSSEGTSRPKVKDLDQLLSCTDWLASPQALEAEGRPELVAASREYRDAVAQGYSVQLWFAYCGKRSENIDKRIRVFNDNPEHQERGRSARACDLGLLEGMHLEVLGSARRIESAEMRVSKDAYQVGGSFGTGLVASVGASQLVSLYEEFGDELFARNVRGWLGARKGSVNAGIIDTLENQKERGNFWAYNNGITVVCDAYSHDPETGVLHLSNFSIVNGCQTTVALARTQETWNPEEPFVLARIISPPEAIIDSVIRFTNSQNLIRRWDLVAQDRTQIRLQSEFQSLDKPVYYVRRRGDWRSLNAQEKRKYRDGKSGPIRRIEHDLLGQYLAAFKGRAVVAYKNKGFLFDRFYEETFPVDLRVEEALFVWHAGQRMRDLVRDEIRHETAKVEKGNSERQKYVLMLKRGGRFYSLAVFGLVARLRNGPDYLRSITEERVTSTAASRRIDKYARVSVQWYKQVVDDLLQITGTEMSVLIRQEDFFERAAERVANVYETWSVDKGWLDSTLPRLH